MPLPFENSLKKLPNPAEAILKDQDLTVVVRGIFNNKKHVWQSLVDVKKIYEALVWLKNNNPLYVDINIPHVELLNDIDLNVMDISEIDDGDESLNEIEMQVENEKKMITQKCESDDFYENLTVWVGNRKQNER